ncbi:MFS transporter [Bifidobacterium biavatii]|nr:glycoside-pentoside-hexuronide (GPH):cation symporter [Bifidobacterium biavatii]
MPASAPTLMPTHRRITFSFLDVAGNLLYCVITGYALYYFTNVYGLSSVAAGAIILTATCVGVIDAPVWGSVIDRTRSRLGRSRPWILRMALPFCVLTWLLFTVPPLHDDTTRTVYAGATYVLAGMCYDGISVAGSAALPNLTSTLGERAQVNSVRMVTGNLGNFAAVTFILPLATWLGGSSTSPVGWSHAVLIFACVSFALLIACFADMRERAADLHVRPPSLRRNVTAASGNWVWWLVTGWNVLFWVGFSIRTSMLPYYFRYVIEDERWTSILNGVSVVQITGMAAVPWLVSRIGVHGKSWVTVLSFALAVVGQVGFLVAGSSPVLLIASDCFAFLGTGMACAMSALLVSSSVDYGEWHSGVRASGFLTAVGMVCAVRLGSGLGTMLSSVTLNGIEFDGSRASQTGTVVSGISATFLFLPLGMFVVAMLPMMAYRRYETAEDGIIAGLQ